MMRDGNWDERQLAMNVAIHLDIPTSADVAEALEVWNGSMDQTVANYLRQIGQEALPPLMRLLTADDPIRRRGAVWALGEMKDNAVVPTLIAALEDQDPMVRREAAVALRQFRDGAAVDSLIKLLRDESWHVRKVAAETLVDAGATAIPVLLRMMQDDRTDVRRIAIGVLGRLGNASAVPALLPYLEDDNSDIRAMAVTALGQIGDESAADGLGTLLSDSITPRWSDATIGQMAKNALEKIGTEKAMSIVNRLRLPSGQASTAQQAKEKLINITRPKPEAENKSTLPAKLQKMLRNSDWQLRRKAIVAIGRTGKRGALPVLLEGLQDSEAEVRLAVMHLLPIYEGKTVLEHLSLALNDDDLTIAQMAAKQLTDIGSVALPILTNAVLSADTDVRALAVQSLGHIAHESAAPILIEALTDHAVPSWSDQTVGKLASEALMQLNTPETIAADTPETVEELEPSRFSPASPEDTLMPMDDAVTASSITAASATSGGPEARQQEQQEQLIKLRDLIDRLQSGEWRKQHKAAKELNKMAKDMRGRRNKVIADKIAMLLSSPDDFVRLSAAEAVAWIADEGAIPLLVPMLKEKSYTIQIAAMRALAEIGERRVVSHITPLLAPNQNQLVREVAAEVLGYLRDKAALPALLEALNDHEGFVRRSVIHALGDIGNLQAVPRLLDFLSDQDAQVRWVTVEALGKIGAPEAVKDLKRLLVDSYEVPYADEFGQTSERRLSEMVVRALENIGTQDAKQAIVDWQASQV
jgi:HEAT repeat protein